MARDKSTLAITNAHVVPIEGEPYDGTVVVTGGRISAVGKKARAPRGAEVVDAEGGWVLPGFVDAHTHVGVWGEGEGWSGQDTNEMTDPVTAQVRALDAIYPADIGFTDALVGGITTVCVNPGSGNVIGGHCVAVHTHGRTVDEMVLRSPAGMKSALGENPKRVYGDQKKAPSTRLGTAAVLREAFVAAQNYQAKQAAAKKDKKPFDVRDLKLEALAMVLDREIPWRQHSHRADDIATAMRIADEFGYELVIDHGTEAHLIADLIAAKGIPVLIGPLIVSRSKVEVATARPSTRAAGQGRRGDLDHHRPPGLPDRLPRPSGHIGGQGRPRPRDRDAGDHRSTPRVLGLDDRIGSLEVGKLGRDLAIWSGDPLDVMQRAHRVFIEGEQVYAWSAPEE